MARVTITVTEDTQEYAIGHVVTNYLNQGHEVLIRKEKPDVNVKKRTVRMVGDTKVIDLGRDHF